jgi:hypothetical protein
MAKNPLPSPSKYDEALAVMKRRKPDLATAADLLVEAHGSGDYRATYALATWYLHGRHFPKSIRSAVKLLRQAASDNIPEAMYDLAICYENGEGMAKNEHKAVEEAYIYTVDDERIAAVRGANSSIREWHYTIRDLGGQVLREIDDTQNGSVHSWRWNEDWIYRDGTLLAAEVAGSEHVRHFHVDHLGTPRLITNFAGIQTSAHTYYPYDRSRS